MLVFIEKSTNRIALYGSLKSLYDNEFDNVEIKKSTMYKNRRLDLEDYEDEDCIIAKRAVVRSTHTHTHTNFVIQLAGILTMPTSGVFS